MVLSGINKLLILKIVLIVIFLLWSGMILGISFLESWIKFRAPGLTKAMGLSVGRTVFNVFHKVQALVLLFVIVISVFSSISLFEWGMTLLLALVYSVQSVVVLPGLNRRVSLILAGETPPKSKVHAIYGAIEVSKLFLLLWLAIDLLLKIVVSHC